VNSIFFQ